MATTVLQYDRMVEEALRGVVRRTLKVVSETGLPGNHHFLLSFRTTTPGVDIADYLKAQYPLEMTIVLQHEFWNLKVAADLFEVSLSFSDIPERLVIPFTAITSFADPPAKFGLQFQQETTALGAAESPAAIKPPPKAPPLLPLRKPAAAPGPDQLAPAAAKPPAPAPPAPIVAEPTPPAGDKIVTLDAFRRK